MGPVARYLIRVNDLSPKRQDKFRAYRARKKAAGLRELRMWVPDFRNPEIKAQLDIQIKRINASKDEQEILDWCEAAAAETWDKPY